MNRLANETAWRAAFGLGLGVAVAAATPALAGDHANLENNFPLVIEDAYPVGKNAVEVQLLTRYNNRSGDPEGENLFEFLPRVEWGALANFQLSVESPYFLGNSEEAESGIAGIEAFYNFNTETLTLPALSVAVALRRPFGESGPDGGTETELTLLSTRSLGTPDPYGYSPLAYVPRQIHVNASWFHNFDPLPDERQDRYLFGIGYTQPVTNNFVLVADILRETERREGEANNMAEIGTRYILTPQTVLSAGVGVGFAGDRSEDYRVMLGVQHALSFPYSRPLR